MNLRHKVYIYSSLVIFLLVVVTAIVVSLYMSNIKHYAVKVNGQEVTVDKFKVYMKVVKKELELRAGVSNPEDIKKMWTEPVEGSDPTELVRQNASDMAIGFKIREQKVKEKGIQLSQQEVNLIKEKMKADGTVKQFNLQEKELEMLSSDLAISNKLSNFITKDVSVTEQELNDYLSKNIDMSKQYNVKHILFLTVDNNGKELSKEKQEQLLKLARQIYERVKKGEDFSKLAKEFSQDPGSKDLGGKFEFYKGEAVKEFQDAAMKLKPNEISEPIKTKYGYHIIKLESITIPSDQDKEVLRKKYKDELMEEKRKQVSDDFETSLTKWKQEANIDKNEKLINSIKINEL